MKTTRTFDFPLRWVAPGLVTGLFLLSGFAVADDDAQKFPATGQTTCFDSAGAIPCAGTGEDGEVRAGARLRYRDQGNGTILDLNTGLTWEKKSDDEAIDDNDNTTFPHDKDNVYTWDDAFAVHVATLNTICENDETMTCAANCNVPC